MTIAIATGWLALMLTLCLFAWFARNWFVGPLLIPFAFAAAFIIYQPLGAPDFTSPPPGKYTVLGAKIIVNEAIYVLLDDGTNEPAYYVLPYSTGRANQLQNAMDTSEGQGGVMARSDGEGGVSYDGEPPVTGEEPKAAEQPSLNMGGSF